ncbi:hypothetical protein ACFOEE_03395 [Pseudoalteromonas fenneropenaei]|uniref:Uncharacterized protein n=1 Tax=Pseudoalteromonas fenneropenaei TaxID=1737459 RepID=A0ABV7CG25_9GAMM
MSCENRTEVDVFNHFAHDQGGVADVLPKQDHGFIYNRNLAYLDGHI